MPPTALPFPWNDYLQFQSADHINTDCPNSLGREEALTAFVLGVDPDDRVGDSESLHRQFHNLCCNRSAKHRHRLRHNEHLAKDQAALGRDRVRSLLSGRGTLAEDHSSLVAVRELLSLLRQDVSESDWQVLWMLAEGYTYGEVAAHCGLTVENLKSRVHRIRSRIRESRVGCVLQAALS